MDSSTGNICMKLPVLHTLLKPPLVLVFMIQKIKNLFFTFKALNFTGRLKRLLGTRAADGGTAALFAIGTPVEPPSITEIRTKTFIFQTKHRMDFAPVGIDTRWVV